jgi:membrane-associated PAP2 superfamily phosphatase
VALSTVRGRLAVNSRDAGVLAVAALLILLVFGVGGIDLRLADIFAGPGRRGFPLRNEWLFAVLGHTGVKWIALAFWALCLAFGGPWRRGALYMLPIVLAVEALKSVSAYSCPWDLPAYGGTKPDAGRCLPAAHPLIGFALFGLYLALREAKHKLAVTVLVAAWLIGLAAGAIQVARGAHFASHVLWTAWIAWVITLLIVPFVRRRERGPWSAGRSGGGG